MVHSRYVIPRFFCFRNHDFDAGFSPPGSACPCNDPVRDFLRYGLTFGSYFPHYFLSDRFAGNMYELSRYDRCLRFPRPFRSRSGRDMQWLPCSPHLADQGICVQGLRWFAARLRLYFANRTASDGLIRRCYSRCAGKLYAMPRRTGFRSVGRQSPAWRTTMLGLPSGRGAWTSPFTFRLTGCIASELALRNGTAAYPAVARCGT